MGVLRMDTKTFFIRKLKDQRGQSSVEYILLLAVMVTISFSIYNSEQFQKFLGPESEFFDKIKKNMSYSYRHGHSGSVDSSSYGSGDEHHTYFNEGETRFFTHSGGAQYP